MLLISLFAIKIKYQYLIISQVFLISYINIMLSKTRHVSMKIQTISTQTQKPCET